MNLISVDIGNSAMKFGFRRTDGEFVRVRIESSADIEFHDQLPAEPCFWPICSVDSQNAESLIAWISEHRPNDEYHLIKADDVPLSSEVNSREQLGRDRLVAAWHAAGMFSDDREVIIIDAGTAVTIDKVDRKGTFQGGVIYPGARSCLRLLADSTSQLPDLTDGKLSAKEIAASPIGKNTEMAILRGIYQAQMVAFQSIVKNMSDNCHVVATGGEVEFVQDFLPSDWHVEPFLVLLAVRELGKLLLDERANES